MAGGFNVHDTEAAEAHHKECMGLAAHRVRHLSNLKTHNSMQNYLQKRILFTSMSDEIFQQVTRTQKSGAGVRVPLLELIGSSVQPVRMGSRLASPDQQTRILHHELRLTRLELLDLMCEKLALPTTTNTYTLLENLNWSFGQKLTMPDGEVYWATDSQYSFTTDSSSCRRRRDNVILHGTENQDVLLPNGTEVERKTALCCQTISFVTVTNVKHALKDMTMPPDIKSEIDEDNDSLTFIIARWFEPHPTATERDCNNLPICPGSFHTNHCLWRFALSKRPRRVLWASGKPTQVFHDQCFMFGKSKKQQLDRIKHESRAYYGLIKLSSIKERVYMAPEFEPYSCTESSTWLQTLTLI